MYSFYIYYYLYSCFLGLNFGVVLVVLLDDCVFMPIRETPILSVVRQALARAQCCQWDSDRRQLVFSTCSPSSTSSTTNLGVY